MRRHAAGPQARDCCARHAQERGRVRSRACVQSRAVQLVTSSQPTAQSPHRRPRPKYMLAHQPARCRWPHMQSMSMSRSDSSSPNANAGGGWRWVVGGVEAHVGRRWLFSGTAKSVPRRAIPGIAPPLVVVTTFRPPNFVFVLTLTLTLVLTHCIDRQPQRTCGQERTYTSRRCTRCRARIALAVFVPGIHARRSVTPPTRPVLGHSAVPASWSSSPHPHSLTSWTSTWTSTSTSILIVIPILTPNPIPTSNAQNAPIPPDPAPDLAGQLPAPDGHDPANVRARRGRRAPELSDQGCAVAVTSCESVMWTMERGLSLVVVGAPPVGPTTSHCLDSGH